MALQRVLYTTLTLTTLHLNPKCHLAEQIHDENVGRGFVEIGPDYEPPPYTEWCPECGPKESTADVMKELMSQDLWPPDREQ